MLYAGVWPNIGRALLFFGVVFTFWPYYYGLRGLVLQYLVGGRGASSLEEELTHFALHRIVQT